MRMEDDFQPGILFSAKLTAKSEDHRRFPRRQEMSLLCSLSPEACVLRRNETRNSKRKGTGVPTQERGRGGDGDPRRQAGSLHAGPAAPRGRARSHGEGRRGSDPAGMLGQEAERREGPSHTWSSSLNCGTNAWRDKYAIAQRPAVHHRDAPSSSLTSPRPTERGRAFPPPDPHPRPPPAARGCPVRRQRPAPVLCPPRANRARSPPVMETSFFDRGVGMAGRSGRARKQGPCGERPTLVLAFLPDFSAQGTPACQRLPRGRTPFPRACP